jgi:hypothetical protein
MFDLSPEPRPTSAKLNQTIVTIFAGEGKCNRRGAESAEEDAEKSGNQK